MGTSKTLIFDFDGTLADTFEIAVSVFRELVGRWQETDDERVEKLRGLSAREALREVGVRWWNLPYVVYRGRKAVKEHMASGKVETIKGIDAVLQTLHQRGYNLFVVSSNSDTNIQQFLRKHHLQKYFAGAQGGVGLFVKARALTAVARQNGLSLKDCTYIGDEVRDIEAARHARMPFVGVTWGFNNRQALTKAGAERLVDTPQDLLEAFPA